MVASNIKKKEIPTKNGVRIKREPLDFDIDLDFYFDTDTDTSTGHSLK